MTYDLNIYNKENLQKLNIRIDDDLKQEDQQFLIDNAHALFAKAHKFQNKSFHFEELKSKIKKIKDSTGPDSELVVSLKKIQKLQVQDTKAFLSRKEMFLKTIKKQRDFPLKFLWILFVAPFLTLHRFHRQNISAELNKIFEKEISTQDQFLTVLEHARNRLDPETTAAPIQEYLKETLKNGFNLEKFSDEEISSDLLSKIEKEFEVDSDKDILLTTIPVTLQIQGFSTPLLFTFRKLQDKLYIDIAGLPEKSLLRSTYETDFSLAKKIVPTLISNLTYAYALPYVQANNPHLSKREKIRLKNIHHLFPTEKKQAPISTFNPEQYLNEIFVNLTKPVHQEPAKKQSDLFLQLYEELGAVTEQADIDKLDWFLVSLEEEMGAFLPVLEKLTPQARLPFIEQIENRLRRIEKKMDDPKNPRFKAFYEHLESFKSLKPHYQATVLSHQKSLQQKIITHTTAPKIKLDLTALTPLEEGKVETTVDLSAIPDEWKTELELLEKYIKENLHAETHKQLLALHEKIDQEIENRNYALAKKIALEVLKRMPIEDQATPGFFSKTPEGLTSMFSDAFTLLAKDIWESSLKLGEFTPDPEIIIQLIKVQVFNKLNNITNLIDDIEIENLIFLHPHIRFGFKPDQLIELEKLEKCLQKIKANIILRNDAFSTSQFRNYPKPPFSVQMMMTCLLKPDFFLTPFFDDSSIGVIKALAWIEGLKNQAIQNGADPENPKELQNGIISIRRKMILDLINSMDRLDLSAGKYATQECVTIIDPKNSMSKNILAYLPKGPKLSADFQKRYQLFPTEKNSEPLAGAFRGEATFLGPREGGDPTNLDEQARLLEGLCLSPQVAHTEPNLLALQYQKPPKGQISQVYNYLLESIQISDQEGTSRALNPGSVIEALNLIFHEQHLANEEVQRTILMLLTRPFLIEQAMKTYPKELSAIYIDLEKVLKKNIRNAEVAPFLLLVGQLLKMQDIFEMEEIPSFEKEMSLEDGETVTGEECLRYFLNDYKANHVNSAITYLYSMVGKPLDALDEERNATLLYCISIFDKTADTRSVPGLNKMVSKWIHEVLQPHLLQQVEENPELVKKWVDLSVKHNFHGNTSDWEIQQNEPFIVENSDFTLNLSSMTIAPKKEGAALQVFHVILPEQVRNNSTFLSLFNEKEIKAAISNSNKPAEFIYTFTQGSRQFKIVHNQTSSQLKIYTKLPQNPFNSKSQYEWYEYIHDFQNQGDTTLEAFIAKQGIWVNTRHPTKAYLFTTPLAKVNGKNSFAITFDKSGNLLKAQSPHSHHQVAFLTASETEKVLPFSEGASTFILTSHMKIEGAYLTSEETTLQKLKNEWAYDNPKIGQRWFLREDLELEKNISQEDLFLKSLKSDWHSFLIPLKKEEQHQYLLVPSEIVATNGKLTFNKKSTLPITHLNPLTLTIGHEMEGSPSAYLYLAYYFAMRKDYGRALAYLKKASKAPAASQQEFAMFQHIARYFDNIPYRGVESLHFQLKAQLTIQTILKTQFSETYLSQPHYANNIGYLAEIYSDYKKKVASSGQDLLKQKEIEALESLLWSSFKQWVDHEPLDTSQIQYAQLSPAEFETTRFSNKDFKPIHESIFASLLVTAKNLNKPLDKEKLKKEPLCLDSLLHYFYDYCRMLEGIDSKEAPEWISYFSNPLALQGIKDPKLSYLAEEARRFLFVLSLEKTRGNSVAFEDFNLSAIRKKLPYFDLSHSFIGVVNLMLKDRKKGESPAIEEIEELTETCCRLLEHANDYFTGKTLGTLLTENAFKPSFDKVEIKGKEHVTFKTISDYFNNLPADHHYLPLEIELITRLVNEKADETDLSKLRTLQEINKAFEAKKYPLYQMRALAENMRKLQISKDKLQDRLALCRKNAENIAPFHPLNLQQQEQNLRNELKAFISHDYKESSTKVKNLTRSAKKYFSEDQEASLSLKEEYSQLNKGFDIAKTLLIEESKKKRAFTNEELEAFHAYLKNALDRDSSTSLKGIYLEKRAALLAEFQKLENLPASLKKMMLQTDLYSDIEIFNEIVKLFKKSNEDDPLNKEIAEALLYLTAVQQFEKAAALLHSGEPALALEHLLSGLELNRYKDEKNGLIARSSLVAEARAGIIFRPGQRKLIHEVVEDPRRFTSLRMGLGKTSYALPTIAELLAEMGHSVVLTVPEKLIKSNRIDIDKATRTLFDQAGMEFSLPLSEEISSSALAEKALQIEQIFMKKGYIITTVEELATLHNTCILLEEEKRKLLEKGADSLKEEEAFQLIQLQIKLHYYKKIDQLLNDTSDELALNGIFFGDEVDETHHITHEVSIATGSVADPAKSVRSSAKTLFSCILEHSQDPDILKLKDHLLNETYTTLKDKTEILHYMQVLALELKNNPQFLTLLDEVADKVAGLDDQEWSDYITGASDQLPNGLPDWNEEQKQPLSIIAATKQLLSKTFPDLLGMKAGNDLGFSDIDGFVIVPKTTKNETVGMRFGDEFEMILAQYLGYLEYQPSKSLTSASDQFLLAALGSLKEKKPHEYAALITDYQKYVSKEGHQTVELIDYLTLPEAYTHRWSILDEVVFNEGYLKKYLEQISTNVQELFHKKAIGGVTGTLDPYSLPFISDEALFPKEDKSSTREVEAETFLRLGLNQEKGLDQPIQTYSDQNGIKTIKQILKDPETTAIINNSGITSEGLNTLDWIASLRKLDEGKNRSYLFMHPKDRVAYLWISDTEKAVPYKNQKLSDQTICIYAPSDVRGVDLPIKKGKVAMLVSPTATTQESVQSLYRARKLGGDHQLILFISDTLNKKIMESHSKSQVTYGDLIQYLVSRTNERRLEQNESAALSRIENELKSVINRFLKRTNPDYDDPNFIDSKNIEKIVASSVAETELFKALKDQYITNKAIDFEKLYEPIQKGSGVDKILLEYKNAEVKIDTLLQKIKESARVHPIDQDQDQVFEELQTTTNLLKEKNHPLKEEFEQYLLPEEDEDLFLYTAKFHRFLTHQIAELNDPEIIERFKLHQKFLAEVQFGKGKTHLYNDLLEVKSTLKTLKKAFKSKIEQHKNYLPSESTLNFKERSGMHEQVKVMQKQQTKVMVQSRQQEFHDKNNTIFAKSKFDRYQTLDPLSLLNGKAGGYDFPLFNEIGMSEEAHILLEEMGTHTGDPLFYVTVDYSGATPTINLITKLDYHYALKPSLEESGFENMAIYLPIATGYRFVNGGGKCRMSDEIPKEVIFKLMTIKAFLGYTNEFMKDENGAWKKSVLKWKQSLAEKERALLLKWIRLKGTPSQEALFTELLG